MINPAVLEEAYHEFTKNLTKWIPDGVLQVDIKLLEQIGLLNLSSFEHSSAEQLTHFFHIIETPEKVTLFNEQFAVWIVPHLEDNTPTTTTLISLIQANKPHLEIVFSTSGVYNTPKCILKILQHYISEVKETEASISSLEQ